MSTVKQLRGLVKNYKKDHCPPYSNKKKSVLINEAKKLNLEYENKTVKELKLEIKNYKKIHCPKIPNTKKELLKDFRIKKVIEKPAPQKKEAKKVNKKEIFKNIEEQLIKESKSGKIIKEEYSKLFKKKKRSEEQLKKKLKELDLQISGYFGDLTKKEKKELEELNNQRMKLITKLNKYKIKNIPEDKFDYSEIANLVSLLPDYLIPVGSFIRKSKNPGDLDIVTTYDLKNVFKFFNDNFKVIEILASGPLHLDIRIEFNQKILGINIWKAISDNLIFVEFAYSYPRTLNIALRRKAKNLGYSLTPYGFLDKSGFLFDIESFKDIFDVLDVEYRTPEEEELRETIYKHIKDGKEALKLIRGKGLLINGYNYNGGSVESTIQDELNKLKYFKKDVFFGELPPEIRHQFQGGIDFLYPIKKIYQGIANKYRKKFCSGKSRPLKVGEIHPLCANFEGPGTRIDLPEVYNYPPYSPSDACAKKHDIAYSNASKIKDNKLREKSIREADEQIIKCLNEILDDEPYKSLGLAGIENKMKIENLIPLLAKLISGPSYFGHK